MLLWSASLVSNIGTWMEIVAIGSLLAKDTGRARDLGILAAAGFLPTAIFAPLGGAISDRVPRKAFLIATLGFDTALAIVLAVVLGTGRWTPGLLWVVFCKSRFAPDTVTFSILFFKNLSPKFLL